MVPLYKLPVFLNVKPIVMLIEKNQVNHGVLRVTLMLDTGCRLVINLKQSNSLMILGLWFFCIATNVCFIYSS